ncbi:MAG: outer membrane beta-barrel protein [Taibaiella sp.]|nr:outer membrane beta-barrel protein [Taibaiella sp.]
MKHTLLSSFLAFNVFSGSLYAQKIPVVGKLPNVDVGLKIGANFEQLNGSTWEQSYKPGISGGAFISADKGKIGLQLEALVNSSQYKFKDSLQKGIFRAIYLQIPLLFQYKIVNRLWVQAGPQFSSILSVKGRF